MEGHDMEKKLPGREKAMEILTEGARRNPGEWKEHCVITAECAERIAAACGDMDPERAYVLGLLHDIGRRFGKGDMRHVVNGYNYMMELGYEEAARICLTHSFPAGNIQEYVGRFDVSRQETEDIICLLEHCEYNDYDRLIQLCDGISLPKGPVSIEERTDNVAVRYGYYPPEKKKAYYRLKEYFEDKMGEDIYQVVCKK